MTTPETAAAAESANIKENAPDATSGGSVFLDRVADIPVVNAAKEYGVNAYNNVKQYNKFTEYAISTAESTALFLALMAKPYLQKIEPQVKRVDQLACSGLDAVEEKAPFLMKPPEELVGEARKLINSSVETGYQKVEEIKAIGTDAISSVKDYGLQKANEAISGTETLVDKLLPPPFGEEPESAASESQSISERASHLTTKVSQRVYGHGVKQIFTLHRLSQESVTKLAYTIDLLQHIKENSNKTVQEYIDEAKVKATWIWEELSKEPSDAAEADKRLEQRMLSLARRMASILVHTYSTVPPVTELSQICTEGVNSASRYAAELFTQFDQALKAGEASAPLLERARDKVAALDKVVKSLLVHSQPDIELADIFICINSNASEFSKCI